MDKNLIEKMVEAAIDVVSKYGDDQNHTVGAAVVTKDGKIITGINVYHFTGGPCGEIVAMGNAISNGEKDLVGIVAIGNWNRGVLSPCGRCRQVLFDYYPDMQVILGKDEGYVVKGVRDLLPDVYDWREQQADDIAE